MSMKLKLQSVVALVKWSWLVIVTTWRWDFVLQQFLPHGLPVSLVTGVVMSYVVSFCWGLSLIENGIRGPAATIIHKIFETNCSFNLK